MRSLSGVQSGFQSAPTACQWRSCRLPARVPLLPLHLHLDRHRHHQLLRRVVQHQQAAVLGHLPCLVPLLLQRLLTLTRVLQVRRRCQRLRCRHS